MESAVPVPAHLSHLTRIPDDKCIVPEPVTTISPGGCVTTITGNIKQVTVPTVTTITSEITCPASLHGDVIYQDFSYDAVPANKMDDVLILTSGVVRDSAEMFLQRISRRDMWFVYLSITIVNLLTVASTISGINGTWYKNLNKTEINPYVIGALWVVATILSYISIFMIWSNVSIDMVPMDMKLSIAYLIGSVLSVFWAIVFFQANQIAIAAWLAAVLFLYQFWLFFYVLNIKPVAAMFLIPILVLYGYLFYSMIHVATINDIIL